MKVASGLFLKRLGAANSLAVGARIAAGNQLQLIQIFGLITQLLITGTTRGGGVEVKVLYSVGLGEGAVDELDEMKRFHDEKEGCFFGSWFTFLFFGK